MSKSNENKNREQNIVLQKWKDSGYKGLYAGFTGVGKTRIGTIAAAEFIRRDPGENSLVIVPTENLRDNEWENSFVKWGYAREREKVQIICIQSAYKLIGQHFNTVVIDEVHMALGDQYRLFLTNNTYDRLLCLTATPPEDFKQLEFITTIAPIIWETSRDRAIELKLVSESMIFNLAVDLTEVERGKYLVINNEYSHHEELLGGARKAYESSAKFMRLSKLTSNGDNLLVYTPENRVIYSNETNDVTLPKSLCRNLTFPEVTQLRQKIYHAVNYWKCMRERRVLVMSAENKLSVTKSICNRYPDRKAIIFSGSTVFADKVAKIIGDTCTTFHSKMYPKDKALALAQFSNNTKQYLSSVKALNAGLDVPECSLGIATSGDSKKLGYIQRNGRTSRYIDNKVSYFINLYCRDTQEIHWIRNGTKLMEPKWISSIDELPIN